MKRLFVTLTGFLLGLVAATAAFAQDSPAVLPDAVVSVHKQDTKPVYRKNNPAAAFALRNNLAYHATGTMNLSMEVALGRHASIGGIFGFKSWDRFLIWDNSPANLSKWRHLALVPELRYYLNSVSQGHYFGADLLYIHYNLGALKFPFNLYSALRDQRVQGDLLGAGLFYGYAWPLSRHWRIEAELGISGGWYSDMAYECPSCGSQIGPRSGVALLPKIGVNIVYTFNKKERGEE
jgi:hypothetical protein